MPLPRPRFLELVSGGLGDGGQLAQPLRVTAERATGRVLEETCNSALRFHSSKGRRVEGHAKFSRCRERSGGQQPALQTAYQSPGRDPHRLALLR